MNNYWTRSSARFSRRCGEQRLCNATEAQAIEGSKRRGVDWIGVAFWIGAVALLGWMIYEAFQQGGAW